MPREKLPFEPNSRVFTASCGFKRSAKNWIMKIMLGFGADWHPNIKNHQVMAAQLVITLREDLKW